MIVLGLLLILVAVGAAVFAVTAPMAAAQTIEVTVLGFKVSASPLAMFLSGAMSVILLGLGFALINRGTRRRASSRKELRQLRKEQAAAGTAPTTPAGERSSRHDRHDGHDGHDGHDRNDRRHKDSSTDTDAGTGTDSSTDGSSKGSGTDGSSKGSGTDSESPSSR